VPPKALNTFHAGPPLPKPSAAQECGSRLMALDWKKGAAPAGLVAAGETAYEGCVACDDALTALCEVRGQR
jgi:hypothetical protein